MQFESITLKYNAKIQYMLINCIDDDNAKIIVDETKFKNIYKKLFKKYKKTIKIIDRQYLIDLINYKKFSNINIELLK